MPFGFLFLRRDAIRDLLAGLERIQELKIHGNIEFGIAVWKRNLKTLREAG